MKKLSFAPYILLLMITLSLQAQDILPPCSNWKGKSEALIVASGHPYITIAEATQFSQTASYTETLNWFHQFRSPHLKLLNIGNTAQGRDILVALLSSDQAFDPENISSSHKPLVLIQAGIHAGEIDGKDAGMMLIRDILTGNKKQLLEKVNIAFIPILNADGHERSSPYNRINQRGPNNMGWRANSRNQNLNRDYTKLDTEEIQAVIRFINKFNPDLYIDLHVTDGADYQYDITYGFCANSTYSPKIAEWLEKKLSPVTHQHLTAAGHIPGPLLFAYDNQTFRNGNYADHFSPRYSHAYSDLRHLPAILVENHSLKPYKQRVLGTYIFLEAVLRYTGESAADLMKAIQADKQLRKDSLALSFKESAVRINTEHLGIEYISEISTITGKEYVRWTGKKTTTSIPLIQVNQEDKKVKIPKQYWIPSTCKEIISRMQVHGIKMEILKAVQEVNVVMNRIKNPEFSKGPVQGRMRVNAQLVPEQRTERFYPGSAIVSTDQELGFLVVALLEPLGTDSYFQWGFCNEIVEKIEYAEPYVMEPLAKELLRDEKLKQEFELKKKLDPKFAENENAIYSWLYSQSIYADKRYCLYPIGMEY